MDLNELTISIEDGRKEIDETLDSMDKSKFLFIDSSIEFIKEWCQKEIEKNVKTNTENTKVLGVENLRELKNDINQLLTQIPQLSEQLINDDNIWVHKYYTKYDALVDLNGNYGIKNNVKMNINLAIRKILGYPGNLLIKYKYLENGNTSDWQNDFHDGILKYRHAPKWPQNMESIYNEYCENIDKLFKAEYHLKQNVKQKEELEALNLWEQA